MKQFNVRLILEDGYFRFDPETMVMLRCSKSGDWVDAARADMVKLDGQLATGACFHKKVKAMRKVLDMSTECDTMTGK